MSEAEEVYRILSENKKVVKWLFIRYWFPTLIRNPQSAIETALFLGDSAVKRTQTKIERRIFCALSKVGYYALNLTLDIKLELFPN